MRNFDLYEFTSLILPGSIALYGLGLLYPELKLITEKEFSVGDLGLFVILAYASGHIVQGFGNIIESLWWGIAGKPTDWIRTGKSDLLSSHQMTLLEKDIPKKLGLHDAANFKISKRLSEKEWFSITRQMYAAVAAASRSSRVDIINSNYGLCRGMTVSMLLLTIMSVIKLGLNAWGISFLLLLLTIILFFRMKRFGKHYARELFVQFLQLQK